MRSPLVALALAAPALADTAGSIVEVGDTLVSAMMMFLGNEGKVYIMDKVEGNAQQINGHSAWASVWDIEAKSATLMDFNSNAFCASGMHLPNGSFATFGGNGAIGPGGEIGSTKYPGGGAASYDATYQNYDGAKSIRILNPCSGAVNSWSSDCQWYDDASVLAMERKRWYSTAEPLADGSIVLIGGFVNGGYINRNYPSSGGDQGGAAENSFEFYPSKGPAQPMQFLEDTVGLNSYAHTFLMPSGKLFVQANYSTMIWDSETNIETPLPDMPDKVVRVYPASGAVAMLPLTPTNGYTPTILFCGGTNALSDSEWGDYSWPNADTWNKPASKDCQRIAPEPLDKSAPTYVQDDDMLEGRTMGQFVILPTGKLLVLNGGVNGTAGYATQTGTTPTYGEMPFGMSLSSGPVGTPAIYDPDAPKGQRWSNEGLGTSTIPRLYHSTALLLPDGSVMIAGSNPNVDVNLTTVFPTTYKAEYFYPPYFSSPTRPNPQGIPTSISYGGDAFDLEISAKDYAGSANDAAGNTTVVLLRPGWTTHAMSMGQRFVQLNNTFTVHDDGSFTLHTAQAPPNANLLTPGPALLFVVVNGVPSVGKMLTVGNGAMGVQPTAAVAVLPDSVRIAEATGAATETAVPTSGSAAGSGGSGSSKGPIVGGVVGGIAALAILGALAGIFLVRRRRAQRDALAASGPQYVPPGAGYGGEHGRPESPRTALGTPQMGYAQKDAFGASSANPSSLSMPLRGNGSTSDLSGPTFREDGDGRTSSFYAPSPLREHQ